ncbi:hypothetical protein AXE65_10350 [Ventosimonas gracilis]|uniref:Hydrolase n=1 Tax=Ventosimonas gracilis TaxID=1680762 RepID=A0A139SWX4_9GAMM|nr:metal-dependent hydrolase [Ventosimonas gracilis]KXU39103.1 hypothetical protein AXE65_10350 [Ventosimonas gracilis]
MDSLTQIVLGGALVAAIVPASERRAALLAGAALGTLPDLDGLPLIWLADNPVIQMTAHRSISHSLPLLALFGSLITWLFWRFGNGRVKAHPWRWWIAIVLALVTHPVLDAFTVYGTQLFWPFGGHPVMWSSVFVIDPLYTLWLLIACLMAWWCSKRILVQRMLVGGLLLSSAYLGWSLMAKYQVEQAAEQALRPMGLAEAPRFSVPLPLSTLLWRVVVMREDGYLIGDRSLLSDKGAMRFTHYPSDTAALRAAADIPAVRELNWFNRGFMRARVENGELVLSDLRMGLEPNYNFNFVVARWQDGHWQATVPRRLLLDWPPDPEGRTRSERIKAAARYLWQRL